MPINGGHPTLFRLVVMHHGVCQELIRLPFVIGVIAVQREGRAFAQLDPLALEITPRASAGQAQAVVIIQVLKIGIDLED